MAADEAKNLNSQKNFEQFGFALVSFLEDDKNLEKQKKQKKQNVRAQVRGSLLIFLGVCNLVFFLFSFSFWFFGFLVSCVLHIMAAFLRAASKLLLTSSLWRARPLPDRHPNHMANVPSC